MRLAYSYLRFSTGQQKKGTSKHRQYQKAVEYAAANDLYLDDTMHMDDEGVSAWRGKNIEQGALGKFLEKAKAGLIPKGSVLIVESLDRVSRDNVYKALGVLQDICSCDIEIVTLIDGRKYNKETINNLDNVILTVLSFVLANEESNKKSSRLLSTWKIKRDKLDIKPLTSIVPKWIRLDKRANTLELIPERAEIVKRIFSMYMNGQGPFAIAKTFNQEGVKPFGKGALWHESYVTKVLRNPAAYGLLIPHKIEHVGTNKKRVPLEPVENYFPPVIAEITFLQTQDLIRSKSVKGQKSVEVVNLFGRLGKCPVCGNSMIYTSKGKTFRYLVCHAAKHGHGACSYRSVPYAPLEEKFIERLQAGLRVPVDDLKTFAIRKELKEAESLIEKHLKERANIIDAIKQGVFRADTELIESVPFQDWSWFKREDDPIPHSEWKPYTVRHELDLLTESIEHGQTKVIKLKNQLSIIQPSIVLEKVKELQDLAITEPLDLTKINAALRTLCSSIVIDYNSRSIVLHFKHTDMPLEIAGVI